MQVSYLPIIKASYYLPMDIMAEHRPDTDLLFKALADPSRRKLLDLLHAHDGRTLNDLCEHLDMTRQGVTQHLGLLEAANLVATCGAAAKSCTSSIQYRCRIFMSAGLPSSKSRASRRFRI